MKNAYEIRLEILQMAHSDETLKFHEKLNVLRQEQEQSETSIVNNDVIEKLFPKTENIINRAEDLYKFVIEK
jgi:hypothetical protein